MRPPSFLIPHDPSTGPRVAGVQGLRAAAALSILTFHVWRYSAPAGTTFGLEPFERYVVPHLPLGVTLLLLLSGFLLYRPFASALLRGDRRPSLTRYLVNRAWRIFPAYVAILLVTIFVFQTALIRTGEGSLEPGLLADPTVLALNLFLLQGFVPEGILTGIGPAWALTAVVTFYAVLPLLVLFAAALAARTSRSATRLLAVLAPAGVLLIVGLAGKATAAFLVPPGPAGGWGADWHSVVERSFFGHADIFGVGLAVAVVHALRSDAKRPLPRWWAACVLVASFAIALPTTKILETETGHADNLSNLAYDSLMAVAGGLLLLYILLPREASNPGPLVRLLETRALVAIGVVSYSLFLWHEPLIRLLQEHGLTLTGSGGFVANELLVLTIALALSICTYHYLERPALVRKARTRRLGGTPQRRIAIDRSGGSQP